MLLFEIRIRSHSLRANAPSAAWCRVVDAFDEGSQQHRQLALFAAGP
jgi:hypothetical protein